MLRLVFLHHVGRRGEIEYRGNARTGERKKGAKGSKQKMTGIFPSLSREH